MSDDIPRVFSELLGIHHFFLNDPELEGGVLYELQVLLATHGKSLKDFGLPAPPPDLIRIFNNRAVMEEKNYNRAEMDA